MRILNVMAAAARAFAPDDVAKAIPAVKKGFDQLSDDIKKGHAIEAAGHTLAAASKILQAEHIAVGWTGLLGALADVFVEMGSGSDAQPAHTQQHSA